MGGIVAESVLLTLRREEASSRRSVMTRYYLGVDHVAGVGHFADDWVGEL